MSIPFPRPKDPPVIGTLPLPSTRDSRPRKSPPISLDREDFMHNQNVLHCCITIIFHGTQFMSVEKNAGYLCATCAGFDWLAWLKDETDRGHILHSRFGSVFEAASTGCRLCELIVQKYEDIHLKSEIKSYYRNCSLKLIAFKDPWSTVRVWGIILRVQGLEQDAFTPEGPEHFTTEPVLGNRTSPTSPPPGIEFELGISVPFPYTNVLQKFCLFRSFGGPTSPTNPRIQVLLDHFTDCCSGSSHKSCARWPGDDSKPEMPTRLIDCDTLRLIETEQIETGSNEFSAPYLILSHCWGTETNLKTTLANYKDMCSSIKLEELPATIRDAIFLTKELGFWYIWVDSFCIIQSDKQSDLAKFDSDWATELPKMHRYYQNAAITLLIETALGDHVGFLEQVDLEGKTRGPEHPRSVPIHMQFGTDDAVLQIDDEVNDFVWDSISFFSEKTPLRARAWTLQEVILSPRKIHVYRSELLWSCASTARHERVFRAIQPGPDQQESFKSYVSISWEDDVTQACQESGFDSIQYRRSLRLQQWYKYVRDYQGRKLTYPSDIFPAISAVASEMASHLGFNYFAGIWIEDAAQGLAWRTYGFGRSELPWRAPSWSWASIKSSVRRPEDVARTGTDLGTFQHDQYSLQVHTIPSNCGIRHSLTPPTALHVEGQIMPFHLWPDKGVISNNRLNDPGHGGLHGFASEDRRLQCEFDCKLEKREYCNDDLLDVVLLRLGTWFWNIHLTRHDLPGREPNVRRFGYALMLTVDDGRYSRVGIARFPDREHWWDKRWESARLTLV